jgi:hypothetical protein
MSRKLKLGAKSEIENMCVAFWCLTADKEVEQEQELEPAKENDETMDTAQ